MIVVVGKSTVCSMKLEQSDCLTVRGAVGFVPVTARAQFYVVGSACGFRGSHGQIMDHRRRVHMKGVRLGIVTYVGSATTTHQAVAQASRYFAARDSTWQEAAQGDAWYQQGTEKQDQLHLGFWGSCDFEFLTVNDMTGDEGPRKTTAEGLTPFFYATESGSDTI